METSSGLRVIARCTRSMLQEAWAEQGSEPDAVPSVPLSYYRCAFRYCPLVTLIWTKKRNQRKGASPTRALPLFLRSKNIPASPGLAGASAMLAAARPGDLRAAAGSPTPWPGEGGPGRGWVCFCGPGGALPAVELCQLHPASCQLFTPPGNRCPVSPS